RGEHTRAARGRSERARYAHGTCAGEAAARSVREIEAGRELPIAIAPMLGAPESGAAHQTLDLVDQVLVAAFRMDRLAARKRDGESAVADANFLIAQRFDVHLDIVPRAVEADAMAEMREIEIRIE